jgi:hypothetical protein
LPIGLPVDFTKLCWVMTLFLIAATNRYSITGKSADEEVAVVRGVLPARIVNPIQRVIEPELDMDRLRRRQSPAANIFRQLMRKLVPARHWAVHPPMRSVARELEEAWPARDI